MWYPVLPCKLSIIHSHHHFPLLSGDARLSCAGAGRYHRIPLCYSITRDCSSGAKIMVLSCLLLSGDDSAFAVRLAGRGLLDRQPLGRVSKWRDTHIGPSDLGLIQASLIARYAGRGYCLQRLGSLHMDIMDILYIHESDNRKLALLGQGRLRT